MRLSTSLSTMQTGLITLGQSIKVNKEINVVSTAIVADSGYFR